MKTTAHHLTTYGNIGLVQVKVEPETVFQFKAGGPEIRTGGLVISESSGEGVVGKLLAINTTDSFLLLTDADILAGAKQNRIINKSILLAPLSKTVLDVSCVERLRWHYTSKNFDNPGPVADPDLRKEKAGTFSLLKDDSDLNAHYTQSVVWSHVNRKSIEKSYASKTESYSDLINFSMEQGSSDYPSCEAENGCNGLAAIQDKKVISVDLFGKEEVYRHYFPMLRDSAFRMASGFNGIQPVDVHEAYYKVLEAFDNFESVKRFPDGNYNGSGSLSIAESSDLVGFVLLYNMQLVHEVFFSK